MLGSWGHAVNFGANPQNSTLKERRKQGGRRRSQRPLSSEFGTHKTVTARSWPWRGPFSGSSPTLETTQGQVDFFWSISNKMPPPAGSICGRLTSDFPLGCLQGGFKHFKVLPSRSAEAEARREEAERERGRFALQLKKDLAVPPALSSHTRQSESFPLVVVPP